MACLSEVRGRGATDMTPRAPTPVPSERRNGTPVKDRALAPLGVYLPSARRLTPAMRSPAYVQMSTAAAITLGLVAGRLFRCGCTRCLNLLLTYPEGCRANCAYCGLARHREAERNYADRNFIRVDWPAAPLDLVVEKIAEQGWASPFHRMCISMITHPRSDEDTKAVLRAWTARIPKEVIPVSILSNPTTMTRRDVADLYALGAETFTVALDACTPEIFDRTRGRGVQSPHSWAKYWEIFHAARDVFGAGQIGMHLIVGLGETDRDVLTLCQQLLDLGGHSHLFCFFPERGTLMDHLPAPPVARWRRLQLARWLIEYDGHRLDACSFDTAGQLVDCGLPRERLEAAIASGVPFRTSGCPGRERPDVSACDRPYGDGPPSDIRSYPFAPGRRDLQRIRRELAESPP
jgi:lipoyl synthase